MKTKPFMPDACSKNNTKAFSTREIVHVSVFCSCCCSQQPRPQVRYELFVFRDLIESTLVETFLALKNHVFAATD